MTSAPGPAGPTPEDPACAARPPAASLVHHRGRIMPAAEAVLPVGSIALRYGVSVFEGIRLYRRADPSGGVRAWLLDQHLERLRNSCRLMGLDEECCAAVPEIVDELVAVNGVDGDAYVRVAVSAANAGGITAPAETALTVSVTTSGRKKWLATGTGARLGVSTWQRPGAHVFPAAAKNISAYAGPRLAVAEARAAGYDTCVLLTAEGLVSEAPTATLFLVEEGRLVTPRLEDAVLPGVTRAWVLAAAAGLALPAAAEPVSPRRLRAADEVFLCGTGAEFTPVREVDGARCGTWPRRPVTEALVDAYFRQARGEDAVTAVRWTAADPRPAEEAAR
ncbi:aminotransferase class IV [Streptomyces sp. NPDC048527]|uniref:aminotransferase class IV n=1 Tax=Streptomyces sp. NPDC048527 TaxID=3365568 RepID=UPI00371066AA